jgi:hypothetical protein
MMELSVCLYLTRHRQVREEVNKTEEARLFEAKVCSVPLMLLSSLIILHNPKTHNKQTNTDGNVSAADAAFDHAQDGQGTLRSFCCVVVVTSTSLLLHLCLP